VSQRLWHSQEMALSPVASWVRLNAASASRKRSVQCSQLCGVWLGFIPSSLSPTSTRPSGATRARTSVTDHNHDGQRKHRRLSQQGNFLRVEVGAGVIVVNFNRRLDASGNPGQGGLDLGHVVFLAHRFASGAVLLDNRRDHLGHAMLAQRQGEEHIARGEHLGRQLEELRHPARQHAGCEGPERLAVLHPDIESVAGVEAAGVGDNRAVAERPRPYLLPP